MTAGKKLKSKLKQKSDVDDKAKIIENIEEPLDNTKNKKKVSKRNKRRLECTQVVNPYTTDECQEVGVGVNKKEKLKCASKEVHFAFLPEKYEPLLEEDENKETIKEEKRNRKKQKYKKYKKNAVKVLRFGWRCLVVGLQELQLATLHLCMRLLLLFQTDTDQVSNDDREDKHHHLCPLGLSLLRFNSQVYW